MTLSDSRRISDELLSAYIDGEVTDQERTLIETAIAEDEELAWRLDSLRQTVTLLHDLPEVALPRSFVFTADQLPRIQEQMAGHYGMEPELATARPASLPPRPQPIAEPTTEAGFWEQVADGWRNFWQGGNPLLRNAAAVSFTVMLLLVGGSELLYNRAMQPTASMSSASEAAPVALPAADMPAPATQAVAIAPTEAAAISPKVSADETQPEPETAAASALQSQENPVTQVSRDDSARAMQAAPASAANVESAEESAATESTITESEVAESEALTQSSDEAATASSGESSDSEEPVVAAAAAAPAEQAPESSALMADIPPGSGGGGGVSAESGGPAGPFPPGTSGEPEGLVPPQSYGFDVNPAGEATVPPAEEAVSASVAAAPVAEAAAAADVAGTPAVEVPETGTENALARSAAPVAEEPSGEPDAEATVEATPEAVALVAPQAVTHSEVVENGQVDNLQADEVQSRPGIGVNTPLLLIAQGITLLLTVVFASLWWSSRTPR